MLFFGTKKAIAYLTSNKLILFSNKGEKDEEVDLPTEVVVKGNVVDKDRFEDLVISLLAKSDLGKQKVVLVLSKELLLETTITPDANADAESEKFFSSTKIPAEKLSKNVYQFEKEVKLIAVNKSLYLAVKDVFERIGWKVVSVVPITLFNGKSEKAELEAADIKEIAGDANTIQHGNFLTDEDSVAAKEKATESETKEPEEVKVDTPAPAPVESAPVKKSKNVKTEEIKAESEAKETPVAEPEPQPSAQSTPKAPKSGNGSSKLKLFLYTLSIAFLVAGGILAFATFGIANNPLTGIFTSVSPTPSVVPTVTPTPIEDVSVKKEEVKVQILNGTGKAGQATTVKNLLVDLGYSDIETGNAKSSDATDTTVVFYENTTQAIRDEIEKELKGSFSSVIARRDPSPSNYDVSITTGEEL